MTDRKLNKLLSKLSIYWHGEDRQDTEPWDWNSMMEMLDEIEKKGFDVTFNSNSVGIFDQNDHYTIVGWTKDKDAEGRWQALISALVHLISTHSTFKED